MSDAPPTPADAQAPAAAESFAPVRFAVLGDAFLDISVGPLDAVPAAGADVEVDAVTQHPGGSALNTAWHLAAQGVHASLYAAVGRDRAGQTLEHALRSESRIAEPAKTLAILQYQPTATCVAMHGAGMDRTFMSAPGAAKTATLSQLLPMGVDNCLKDVTHLHIGGFYATPGTHGGCPRRGGVTAARREGVRGPRLDPRGEWRRPRCALDPGCRRGRFVHTQRGGGVRDHRAGHREGAEALVGDDRVLRKRRWVWR